MRRSGFKRPVGPEWFLVVGAALFGSALLAVVTVFSFKFIDLATSRAKVHAATEASLKVLNQKVCTIVANTRYTQPDLTRIEKAIKCPLTKALPRLPAVVVTIAPDGVRATTTLAPQPAPSGLPDLPVDPGATITVTSAPIVRPTDYVTRTQTNRVRVTTTVTTTTTVVPPGAVCAPILCTP